MYCPYLPYVFHLPKLNFADLWPGVPVLSHCGISARHRALNPEREIQRLCMPHLRQTSPSSKPSRISRLKPASSNPPPHDRHLNRAVFGVSVVKQCPQRLHTAIAESSSSWISSTIILPCTVARVEQVCTSSRGSATNPRIIAERSTHQLSTIRPSFLAEYSVTRTTSRLLLPARSWKSVFDVVSTSRSKVYTLRNEETSPDLAAKGRVAALDSSAPLYTCSASNMPIKRSR